MNEKQTEPRAVNPARPTKKEPISEYGEMRNDVCRFSDAVSADYKSYRTIREMFCSGDTEITVHRRVVRHNIDETWVDMIENSLPYIDRVIRRPRVELQDFEDVRRIEVSRNIGSQSIKDLARHSDYISTYDEASDMITPSKILNVYREDNEFTYENKFVNTLIRNLSFFVDQRYSKMSAAADEMKTRLEMTSNFHTPTADGKYSLSVELSENSLTEPDMDIDDVTDKDPLIRRITKIKQVIEGFRGSELCKAMGEKNIVRPPISRTNAILKNKDLNVCLQLWEYISSYTQVGYKIEVTEDHETVDDLERDELIDLGAFQYAAFRYRSEGEAERAEMRDSLLYDYEGIEETITKAETKTDDGEEEDDEDIEALYLGGEDGSGLVYAGRDILSPEDREILKELNAALKADAIFNDLAILGKQNISRYLSLGMSVEQLTEMAERTEQRRSKDASEGI